MEYHVDGTLVPADTATLSLQGRDTLYGDGLTERLRAYNGAVFEWDAHRERIERDCDSLSIPVPEALHDRIEATLGANDLADASLTVSITRGGDPTPPPDLDATPRVVIGIEPAPRGGRETADSEPVTVQTVTVRRSEKDPLAERRTRLLARLEVARAATPEYRAEEALIRDAAGFLIGTVASDLLFVDESGLCVPASDPVTTIRPVLLSLAHEEGIPIETGRYLPSAVREADEAFLASPTAGIRPIERLDGIAVGNGPVRNLLAMTFGERIENRYY
jgi:branched-chain amino acid aminotransferase